MALVVQKYGGTSVADIERIENVARKVIRAREAKNDLVVVVSAMAGETDRLIRLAHSAAPEPTEREYDVLIASGEQVTVALLSIVLNRMGCKAKSYLAYQVKIVTDGDFTRARILKVDRSPIEEDLRQGYVVVVAGFQGIDRKNNVTTLGRGGRTRAPWRWRQPLGRMFARSVRTSTASTPRTRTSATTRDC